MSDPDQMPAFSHGARDLLRTLIDRGLSPDAIRPAASLVVALDSGLRTSATSASSTDAAAAELLSMLDAASEEL